MLQAYQNQQSTVNPSEACAVGRYTFLPIQQELWHQQKLVCKLSYRETQLLQLLLDQKKARFWKEKSGF